jgi:hypothetical protein
LKKIISSIQTTTANTGEDHRTKIPINTIKIFR